LWCNGGANANGQLNLRIVFPVSSRFGKSPSRSMVVQCGAATT